MVKEKKDQNTEQKILQAAREIFMEKGMDGARMQDIADRAGMNKALLHYYFRNKEKLFETVFTEAATSFLSKVVIITTTESSVFTKIEQFVHEYISMLVENPYLPLFILNEVNKQPKAFIMKLWGNKRPPVQLFLAQVKEEGQKGNIKPIEPEQLMVNMVSMCIFPFVARPMVQWVHQMNDEAYWQFIERRKTEVSKFIIDSIRK
jgi:TetR/AcrR family transcriptional regulator